MSGQAEYNVGDVLYVFNNEKHLIVPVQVVSVTLKRTFDDTIRSYEIVTPAKPDRPVDISRLPGEIYTSLQELRQYMMNNAQQAIDGMVRKASDVAEQIFEVVDPCENKEDIELMTKDVVEPFEKVPEQTPPGKVRVTLPGGEVVFIDPEGV